MDKDKDREPGTGNRERGTLANILAEERKNLTNWSWIDEITALDEDGDPNDYARRVVTLDVVFDALSNIEAAAERERNRQYEPKCDWSIKDALALANTLANHGLRDGNADAASSCIYSLCRILSSPGNAAALRQALGKCYQLAYGWEANEREGIAGVDAPDAAETLLDIQNITNEALAAPARNCDLIANELNIDPERVPAELNRYENAPIRELIRWIFAKAEPKGGMSKPTPEESAVADVARSVAADMRRMELKCWKGRRMGAYAVALMLGAYASRLEDAYNRPPRKEEGAV